MNQSQKFTEDDIPYNILNRFGFTREMIEDMPDAIITKLKNGQTTPVLPIQVGETGACWDSMGGMKQCRNLHFRAGRQD